MSERDETADPTDDFVDGDTADDFVEEDTAEDIVEDNTDDLVEEDTSEDDALMSRLHLIEDQPLEARAAAFAQVHDELQGRLDGDAARSHG